MCWQLRNFSASVTKRFSTAAHRPATDQLYPHLSDNQIFPKRNKNLFSQFISVHPYAVNKAVIGNTFLAALTICSGPGEQVEDLNF